MNALTIQNAQSSMRVVVLSHEGIVRPVAMASEQNTHQCVCVGDTMVYKIDGTEELRYSTHGNPIIKSKPSIEVETVVLDKIAAFLNSDLNSLPAGLGWNGVDTIQSVALDLGLDIFLTGLPSVAVLGGLMNLDTSVNKPKIGNFHLKQLFKLMNKTVYNSANEIQINRMLNGLEQNYKEWLSKNGVVMHDDSQSWRHAKQLPEVLSVSCIIDSNGKPVRFNDLVIWRELDEEPEVISIFDIVTTFKMDANFITLPYVIGEDVKRIMYVLHDESLSDDGDNVIWLYKKR